jgi:hypothetical protein
MIIKKAAIFIGGYATYITIQFRPLLFLEAASKPGIKLTWFSKNKYLL